MADDGRGRGSGVGGSGGGISKQPFKREVRTSANGGRHARELASGEFHSLGGERDA